jgi:hypothetical protein
MAGDRKGSPLRYSGRPQGIALTVWRATARDRPYDMVGDRKGSPLRYGGRPQGITLTVWVLLGLSGLGFGLVDFEQGTGLVIFELPTKPQH